jgi:acyl-CoA synthetase (NDP forming)
MKVDEMAQMKRLEELEVFFHPKSLALVGASAKQGKVGRLFMDRFLETGFRTLYPVNPGADEILELKAYPSLKDIPGPVDLALIVTPPESVMGAIRDCVAKGVKGIIINSAGFGEAGERGKEMEREMARVAREGGARIIGPNCVGIYCPSSKLPFPLGPGQEPGSVGVVSQSGSLADYLALIATKNGVKFSKAISCGNESDLHAVDFLEYLGEDSETRIIVSYLEGIKDGRRFHRLIREISNRKPMIVWKSGTTEAGARAAASHTGALAGSVPVWEAVLNGAGMVRVKSLEEMLDTLYAFYFQPLPLGKRVGIITGPGGPAVGTADACVEMGLEVPRFSDETKRRLRKVIPPAGTSVENPVDLTLTALVATEVYRDVIDILANDDDMDMLLVIGCGGKDFPQIVSEVASKIKKPLVVSSIIPMDAVLEESKILMGNGIPLYPDPRRAVKALAGLAMYSEFRRRKTGVSPTMDSTS